MQINDSILCFQYFNTGRSIINYASSVAQLIEQFVIG